MNGEIGAEAALFPEKEYIYGIFVAVYERPPKSLIIINCEVQLKPETEFLDVIGT